jgi:hypothetical protein
MQESKLRDKCPACGALRIVFEPYIDPVAEPRRRILRLDLHPIAVHFPTSFAVSVLVLSVAALFFSGDAQTLLICTIKIMALLLPLVVIISIIAGIVDGKIRFRKIQNSMILKKKIIYGCVLVVISLGLLAVIWLKGFGGIVSMVASIILSALAVVMSYLLAKLGMSIANSSFPGK